MLKIRKMLVGVLCLFFLAASSVVARPRPHVQLGAHRTGYTHHYRSAAQHLVFEHASVGRNAIRTLLQSQGNDAGGSDAGGIFTASDQLVSRSGQCQEVEDILTDTPDPDSSMGNFTQQPSVEMLQACSGNSSAAILNGATLADALALTSPAFKVLRFPFKVVSAAIWPEGRTPPHFAVGSVNIVDCGHQLLDMRNYNIDDPTEDATVMFMNCHLILGDIKHFPTIWVWGIDVVATAPCNGTSALSTAAQFTRSDPHVVEDLNFGDFGILYSQNTSFWCYDSEDLVTLYDDYASGTDVSSEEIQQNENEGREREFPVIGVSVGAATAVCLMLVGVWLCLGRPCCSLHRESQTSTRPLKHDKRHLLSTEVGRGSRIHDRTASTPSVNVNSGPITNSTALSRTPLPPENSLASEAVNAYLANLPCTVEGSTYDTAISRGSSSRSVSADNPSAIEAGFRGRVPSTHGFDSWAFDSSTLGQPAPDAPRQNWLEYLHWQLDGLTGKVVCSTLRVLPGHRNRPQGGQAVVQVVEDLSASAAGGAVQYAMKFFLSAGAFTQEKELYEDANQPLGRFLPQLHSVLEGEEGGLRDHRGALMPPCIVMEKGEALDMWIDSSGDCMDLFTGLQVLTHIADRLQDLHGAGYVHRDIKPGNIMWLPRTKRWTVIDFGCAACTGSHTGVGLSLYYAAPEALRSYMRGDREAVVTEALDAWSLGVLAIELLTGRTVFDRLRPKKEQSPSAAVQVMEMIMGDLPTPWEDAVTARALLQPLGIFKAGVLGLLERDPAQRSTIYQFRQACMRAIANTSVTASYTQS